MNSLNGKIKKNKLRRIATNLFHVTFRYMDVELFGFCPFCKPDKPTFCYSYKDDHFHCYSCCADGDIVDLWLNHKGIERSEGSYSEFCNEFGIATCPNGKGCRLCDFING